LRTVHLPASHADHEPPSSDTRKSLAALQHIRIKVPFFSQTLFEPASDRLVPYPSEVPYSGFGYPLYGVRPSTLGGLFQPPTLLGFPLQSFSPTRRSKQGFPCSLRSCAFVRNLSASYRRFSGFLSPGEPYPGSHPGLLHQVGAACSLGFLWSLRLSLRRTDSKASPFRVLPLVLCSFQPYGRSSPGPQGSFSRRPRISLRGGCGPV
jgi:hypothetical protein